MYQSSEVGFIGDIFSACIRALAVVAANCDSPEAKPRIQEEMGRLALWGDGFDVFEGELDQILESSDHLKESTVVLLASIANTLVKRMDSDSDLAKYLYGFVDKAEKLVPETTNYFDEDDDSDVELSVTVDEIKELNDCLYDLVPFLETVPRDTPSNETPEVHIPPTGRVSDLLLSTTLPSLRIEARSYQRNILDKFPNADPELVGVMAELNWLRHERIRDLTSKDGNGEDALEDTLAKSEVDTSTIPTSFQPSSIFSKAESCLSTGTSVYEANQSMNHVLFPNPPIKLSSGKPFTCTICSQTLKNINARTQWKAHVLKDLQPYSCTFMSCPAKNETFGTRRSWINHEFDNHRFITEWICIKECGRIFDKKESFVAHIQSDHLSGTTGALAATELETTVSRCEQRRVPPKSSTIVCPFCREDVEETRMALHIHLGIHMEEISLTALPQNLWGEDYENYGDKDAEEDSDEEHDSKEGTESESEMYMDNGDISESVYHDPEDRAAVVEKLGPRNPYSPKYDTYVEGHGDSQPKPPRKRTNADKSRWTKISCDIVARRAVEAIGYDFEEQTDSIIIFEILDEPQIDELVELSERIRSGAVRFIRRERSPKSEDGKIPYHNPKQPPGSQRRGRDRDATESTTRPPHKPINASEPAWTKISRDIIARRAVEATGYSFKEIADSIVISEILDETQIDELIDLTEKIRSGRERSPMREEVSSPRKPSSRPTDARTQWTKISRDIVTRRAVNVIGYDFQEQADSIVITQTLNEAQIDELVELTEKIRSTQNRSPMSEDGETVHPSPKRPDPFRNTTGSIPNPLPLNPQRRSRSATPRRRRSINAGEPRWTKISTDIVTRRAVEVIGYDFQEQEDSILIFQILNEAQIDELIELSEGISSGTVRVIRREGSPSSKEIQQTTKGNAVRWSKEAKQP